MHCLPHPQLESDQEKANRSYPKPKRSYVGIHIRKIQKDDFTACEFFEFLGYFACLISGLKSNYGKVKTMVLQNRPEDEYLKIDDFGLSCFFP